MPRRSSQHSLTTCQALATQQAGAVPGTRAHRARHILHLLHHVPVLNGRQVGDGVAHGDGAQGGADLRGRKGA